MHCESIDIHDRKKMYLLFINHLVNVDVGKYT